MSDYRDVDEYVFEPRPIFSINDETWKSITASFLKGQEKKDAIEWFRAVCMFTGANGENTRRGRALSLAKVCNHPDAKWFVSCVNSRGGVHALMNKVVFKENSNDEREQFFYECEIGRDRTTLYGGLYHCSHDQEKVVAACLMRNPHGYEILAQDMYKDENDQVRAKILLKEAADYGHVSALIYYCAKYKDDETDINIYLYQARLLYTSEFLSARVFFHEKTSMDNMNKYRAGYALSKIEPMPDNYHNKPRFKEPLVYGSGVNAELRASAIEFYKQKNKVTRDAVDAWSIIARRKRVVKDIRIMIAKMLWSVNEEAWLEREDNNNDDDEQGSHKRQKT